jgi:hypothetical protein
MAFQVMTVSRSIVVASRNSPKAKKKEGSHRQATNDGDHARAKSMPFEVAKREIYEGAD